MNAALGHIRRSAQPRQSGRCAWHVRRPWRSRLRCSSSSSPGGVIASIVSWSSSNGAPGRNSPSRQPTRETCVSTGTSRIPSANSSTQAAVLRPTPGSEVRYPCASGTGWPASQSSDRASGPGGRGGAPSGRGAVGDRPQDRLDPRRLDLRDPAGADRLLDLVDRRVADRPPNPRTARAARGRRRRGCGRWSTARARSGSARRSDGRAARRAGSRTRAAAGRGSRGPAARDGRRQPGRPGSCAASQARPTARTPPAGRRPPRAAPRRRPPGRSPPARAARAARPSRASPAPTVDRTAAATPGASARSSPRSSAPRGAERDHDEPRAGLDQRERRPLGVVLAGHQRRLGRVGADQQRARDAGVRGSPRRRRASASGRAAGWGRRSRAGRASSARLARAHRHLALARRRRACSS